MKKSVFGFVAVTLAALSGNLLAGYYDAPVSTAYSTGKSPIDSGFAELDDTPICACFEPGNVDIDVFAGYAWGRDDTGPYSDDGFTTGLGIESFYSEMLGFRLQGSYWNSFNSIGETSGSIIFRYPIKRYRLAPRVYGGPGGIFPGDGDGNWTAHLGCGVEYRFDTINCLGATLDFRHTWIDDADGYYMLTLGLKISL